MSQHKPIPVSDLEEEAQGHELFRAPGGDLLIEQARDQAAASGWLPSEVGADWPSQETHDQIVNRRQDLYDAMQRLESSVARASGKDDWAEVVGQSLIALHEALRRHVSEIEGDDGLFAEVIDRSPHLAPAVEGLRKDHEDLLVSCRLASDLVADWAAPAEIRRKVLGILGRLAIHRQRGSELLFDTYDVDLAAGN